ncbi:MAG: hypothetical protein MUC86_16545, partial [Burkholderiaceae bacterium]|nr:hypothetical protein [Burkholderiaceae bacterium]
MSQPPLSARGPQRTAARLALRLSLLVALALPRPGVAADGAAPSAPPGATLQSLLTLARERHPELRAMQYEADAAAQRVGPAGALPDPMLNTELRDVTNEATGGNF